MIELYKCLNEILPDIMSDVLAVLKHQYVTRYYNLFVTDRLKTDKNGQNSISYRAN